MESEPLSQEELEAEQGEELPDREALSTVGLEPSELILPPVEPYDEM